MVTCVSTCPQSKSESTSFTDKKSKRKKEKPSDLTSDDISDCLAKLSLQSSSAPHPQTPPPVLSKTDGAAPAENLPDRQRTSAKDQSGVSDLPNTPACRAPPVTAPSPRAVIDALHLSSIDWDAASFTSSPLVQSAAGRTAETGPIAASSEGPRCVAQMCDTERPLRERLLIKAMARSGHLTEGCKRTASEQLSCSSSPTPSNLDTHEEPPADLNRVQPLSIPYTSNRQEGGAGAPSSSKTTNKHGGSKKPQKYKFVKKVVSSSDTSPRKRGSDPSQSRRKAPGIKSSVCVSLDSSSEESDTENQQVRPRGGARIKPANKIRAGSHSDVALKPISGPQPPSNPAPPVQLRRLKPQGCGLEIGRNTLPVWEQGESPAKAHSDPFGQSPASPAASSDGGDSVVYSESPLPLAERLRLKFLK